MLHHGYQRVPWDPGSGSTGSRSLVACPSRLLAVGRPERAIRRPATKSMGMDESLGGPVQAPGLKSVPAGGSEDPPAGTCVLSEP